MMGAVVFVVTFVVTFVARLALSYGITAGLLWLICLCFGWTWWSWQVGNGIWLVLIFLKMTFGRSDK